MLSKLKTIAAIMIMTEDCCQRDALVLVQDDEDFHGVALIVEPGSGDAISLSARNVADVARWAVMPSLAAYPALRTLDLSKCRYITHLNESIGQLTHLQRLSLARCERLISLPDCIGSLENLQEVSLI
jgi:Leucine-rich repeat (LRR) protein